VHSPANVEPPMSVGNQGNPTQAISIVRSFLPNVLRFIKV